jgi:hypothetical protein
MAATRIVAVGAGGSTSFLEDMARAGVGEFVLVDPDVTEEVNLATQHAWPADVGTPKVAALGQRLGALNPACRVWTVPAYDHELSDQAFARLACGVLPGTLDREPATSILCGFTDDFWAQARLSRLALHLGIPYLAAAVYQEGRGLELAFAVPGVTPACTRCALDRRYEHYLDHGYENAVGSAGTPIVATSRLNALKQLVTLAIVHGTSPLADPEHPATRRHRKVLQRIRDRNLVQVRLDPDLSDHLGISVFDAIAEADPKGRLVLDETVWLQQEPNGPGGLRPVCADCGGTGDLRGSAHTFIDTRQMPRAVGDGRRR